MVNKRRKQQVWSGKGGNNRYGQEKVEATGVVGKRKKQQVWSIKGGSNRCGQ